MENHKHIFHSLLQIQNVGRGQGRAGGRVCSQASQVEAPAVPQVLWSVTGLKVFCDAVTILQQENKCAKPRLNLLYHKSDITF